MHHRSSKKGVLLLIWLFFALVVAIQIFLYVFQIDEVVVGNHSLNSGIKENEKEYNDDEMKQLIQTLEEGRQHVENIWQDKIRIDRDVEKQSLIDAGKVGEDLILSKDVLRSSPQQPDELGRDKNSKAVDANRKTVDLASNQKPSIKKSTEDLLMDATVNPVTIEQPTIGKIRIDISSTESKDGIYSKQEKVETSSKQNVDKSSGNQNEIAETSKDSKDGKHSKQSIVENSSTKQKFEKSSGNKGKIDRTSKDSKDGKHPNQQGDRSSTKQDANRSHVNEKKVEKTAGESKNDKSSNQTKIKQSSTKPKLDKTSDDRKNIAKTTMPIGGKTEQPKQNDEKSPGKPSEEKSYDRSLEGKQTSQAGSKESTPKQQQVNKSPDKPKSSTASGNIKIIKPSSSEPMQATIPTRPKTDSLLHQAMVDKASSQQKDAQRSPDPPKLKMQKDIPSSNQPKADKSSSPSKQPNIPKSSINSKEETSNTSKIACQIPKLNPFDKLAVAQMKDVRPLKCRREYFSYLKDGFLHFKVKEAMDAFMQYIKRPFENDFEVAYSDKVRFSNPYASAKLKKGKIGCLVSDRDEIIGLWGQVKGEKNRRLFSLPKKDCKHEHFWYLQDNGRIEHYTERHCIRVNKSSTSGSLFVATPCDDKAAIFNFDDEFIKDGSSGLFLSINKTRIGRERWKLLESSLHDIDIKQKVEEDFVRIAFIKDRYIHEEFHAQVKENATYVNEAKSTSTKASLPYNVAFFLLDSQSHSNIIRKLPKTYKTLRNDENTVIFEGHSIVGDGTTAQLCAMFAGALEEDLPEGRRGFPGAAPVDRWPFLFKDFRKHGYLTLYSEEEPMYGSFNYRLHGFKHPPTHHYGRPFWMGAKVDYYFEGECVGNLPVFQKNFDYAFSFHDRYKGVPKLSLTSVSTICHNNVNRIQNADLAVADILNRMKKSGHMNDTMLVIFGDHGARLSGFRETMVGKLEERLPFMSITLPSHLTLKYPEILSAMKHNSKVLTSHFDIHAMLRHLLTYPKMPDVKTGRSLLTPINAKTRDCADAGIKEHWCPCLQFTAESVTSNIVVKAAKAIVEYINNNITRSVADGKLHCAELQLDAVKRAGRRRPNEQVRRFIQTSQNKECVDCNVILQDEAKTKDSFILELVFSVKPSGGVFESSVTVVEGLVIVNPDISRINRYGDQPKCIAQKYPFLRKFCLCKN